MLVLYAYSSYLLAQGLGLSGIVSILFCGIVMAHYTRKNVSPSTKHLSIELCELLAFMSETFVFAYLGLSIFSLYTVYDWSFTLFAIVRIGHSIHPPSLTISHSRYLTHSLVFCLISSFQWKRWSQRSLLKEDDRRFQLMYLPCTAA